MNRPQLLVNASALASASLWRILLSFILFWYIARTLGVDALGQYALGMAYLNVAAILSDCGLPNLLVRDLAQHTEWRSARMKHALSIQLGCSLLIWGALVVIGATLASLRGGAAVHFGGRRLFAVLCPHLGRLDFMQGC